MNIVTDKSLSKVLIAATCTLLIVLCPKNNAVADPKCLAPSNTIQVGQAFASASMFDNFLQKKGSIRYELVRLYKKASRALASEVTRLNDCAQCKATTTSAISLTSIPAKFLNHYAEEQSCSKRLDATSAKPLTFPRQKFNDVDTFVAWYGDFSRGSGPLGEKLYEQCAGSCSPQYFLTVLPDRGSLFVDTHVICGHARDKQDNSYNLSASISVKCEE